MDLPGVEPKQAYSAPTVVILIVVTAAMVIIIIIIAKTMTMVTANVALQLIVMNRDDDCERYAMRVG